VPLICAVGDLVTDVVVHLDSDPQRGTDTPARVEHVRGGSAANVAISAVASGGSARFVGQVGDDDRGRSLIDELERLGVEALVTRRGITGTIVVLVDQEGERSFLTDRGASVHLGSAPTTALDDVAILHIPAYSFMFGGLADTSHHLIGEAVDRGIPISISTSSISALAEFGRDRFMALVKHIRPELVIANRDEARYLLKGHPWFTDAAATVITAGDRPARVVRPDGRDVRVAPSELSPHDTTGAGDAFTGAFLVAYASGEDDDVALQAGHAMARRTLDVTGPGLGPQDRADGQDTK
jgi:sugar/nucleoside kinase (ribokinase family)